MGVEFGTHWGVGYIERRGKKGAKKRGPKNCPSKKKGKLKKNKKWAVEGQMLFR